MWEFVAALLVGVGVAIALFVGALLDAGKAVEEVNKEQRP